MISSKLVPVLAVIDLMLLGVIAFAGQPAQAKPAAPEEVPYEAAPSDAAPESVVTEAEIPEAEISDYDTLEVPTLEDFLWITPDIINGICPPDEQAMMFDEALGGWKCYVWDEYAERFANMYFEGAEDDLTLTFDWGYLTVGVYEDVYEDTTPDFVYHGTLASSGNVEADGSGRVVLTDFYRLEDHQYAFGTMYWPDGVASHLMLVRP